MSVRKLPKRDISYYGEKQYLIAEGSFGVVYKYENFAIKFLKPDPEYDKIGITGQSIIEMALLNKLHHPNVMYLIDVINVPSGLAIVMDMAEDTANLAYIRYKGENRLIITYNIICGLSYLHSRSIIHRDIKPSNILIFPGPIAKIADLGSCLPHSCTCTVINDDAYTTGYKPPELVFQQGYHSKADIWSLGCVIYSIFTGNKFISADSWVDEADKMIDNLGGLPDKLKESYNNMGRKYNYLKNVIDRLMSLDERSINYPRAIANIQIKEILDSIFKYDPTDRPSAYQLLANKLFDNIRGKNMEYDTKNCQTVISYDEFTRNEDYQISTKIIAIILSASAKLKATVRTIECAIEILDRYIMLYEPHDIKLVALASLSISINSNMVQSIDADEIANSVKNIYTSEDILSAQKALLLEIDCDAIVTVPEDYRIIKNEGDPYSLLFFYCTDLRYTMSNEDLYTLNRNLNKIKDKTMVKSIKDKYHNLLTIIDSVYKKRLGRSLIEILDI